MGKRGPRPKPSILKKLAGTYRPSRAARNEVTFAADELDPPPYLDADAKKEWLRLAPLLARTQLLSAPDLHQLAQYCEAFSLCRAARAAYRHDGLTIANAVSGVRRPHPLIAVAESAARSMLRFSVEFGLTPASRSRVSTDSPSNHDSGELAELLALVTTHERGDESKPAE